MLIIRGRSFFEMNAYIEVFSMAGIKGESGGEARVRKET